MMTLLNPDGLAFLGLAPLIILLYLLKQRRQPARVSTLMFWQRVTAESRRRALWQRLRRILSLLLQLLIFALILLALARPEGKSFHGDEAPGQLTVVILDCRARMQATIAGGGTRFEQARKVAASYLRRATARNPMALLAMEGAPRVAVGSSGDERTLLDGLDALQPTDAGGNLDDALRLARAMGGRVVLVSDPAPAAPRENVGIVRLGARALPGSPDTDEVLVELENFGPSARDGRVELSFEGNLLDVKPFHLAPGERRTDVYPAVPARSGVANARGWLQAHLVLAGGADAFPLDDDAYAVIPPPQPLRVLLVTRGDFFLESLLKADDSIEFEQLAPDAFQLAHAADFNAVVMDDCLPEGLNTPAQLPPGNFLFLHQAPLPADPAGPLEHPLVTDADGASPLLRQVRLSDVTILRAQAWAVPTADPSWRFATPVRSFDHPLVVTGERTGGGRLVALAFGAADSDLPLRIAFPLFVHNAIEWLGGRDAPDEGAGAGVRAGEPIQVPAGETLWTRPQRAYQPIAAIPASESVAGPAAFLPETNGFYLLRAANGADRWLAVNTGDRAMSDLNEAPAGGTPLPKESGPLPAPAGGWRIALGVWPPWVYLALAGFVLCTLEWWGFHSRRTE
jgi:hypothetical protein